MININIDNLNILIKSNISILEACKYIGINIPKFCYHESLSVAGNCRMCLVELQKTPKPVASCAMPVVNNMTIFTSTPLVKKARENVLETLLINHPLDCPICDQGGECDLQDETKTFGLDYNRFFFGKRSVEDKECGLVVKTIMTRCIHCTRCVRFSSEIAGNDFFGTINRGTKTEISNYINKTFDSFLSGNVIDLCPVGALTSKNYAFKARPWELKSVETIDLTDSSGTSIYFNFKESEIIRVIPKINKDINENWISDRIRFSFDAFNNSRLHSIFEKKSDKSYTKTNWNFLIKQLKTQLLSNDRTSAFLINNEIDLESSVILKKLVNYSKNKILVLNTDFIKQENLYISWLTNKINNVKKSKICFLLFVNTYIENLVINTKLKVKYNKSKFDIFNFGNYYNTNFPINFSNISIKNFVSFFESKLKKISKNFIEFSNPLIIMGENITYKLSTDQNLIFFLRKISPSSIILNTSLKCNTEGLKLTNINFINSSNLRKINCMLSVNLPDNIYIRKYTNNKNENFWLNSHGSAVALKNKYIIPVLNNMEEKNIFINLEQRPNETTSLFTKINNSKSTKFILKYILKLLCQRIKSPKNKYNKYKNLDFLDEILINSYLFKRIYPKMSIFFNNVVNTQNIKYFLFSNYSIKSIAEDFFLINTFCKNSLTMSKFSLNYRRLNKNFYF